MISQNVIRAAYYLRISTEAQELDNQRREIMPFIERRGWKLVHPFEDVVSGRKGEKDRLVSRRCLRQLIKESSTSWSFGLWTG
jgi:DNA invertase Pin-like site-specific DNA recombinase